METATKMRFKQFLFFSFRYFGISIAVFTIIVGSIGNTLTILAYALNKKMRTTFNIFVVNLSCVDLITALLMLPFNLAGYVQLSWWVKYTTVERTECSSCSWSLNQKTIQTILFGMFLLLKSDFYSRTFCCESLYELKILLRKPINVYSS